MKTEILIWIITGVFMLAAMVLNVLSIKEILL